MATSAHALDTNANFRSGRLNAVRRMLAAANSEVMGAWAIWAVMSLAGLCFVAIYSLYFPFGYDEWRWVGQVTGDEPVTLSWLWSQHNEHRMFLPRLIYLGLGAISGYDFRAGSLFNVCMLSGLSLAMMMAARSLRGKTRLYDAFFPLLLLNWGQFDNLIWGFQLNFVSTVVIEGLILLILLRCGSQITLRLFAGLILCLVLLGLCGTYGLIFLPPFVCWMLYASVRKWQSEDLHARRDALFMFLLAAFPAVLVPFYLHGLSACSLTPGFFASIRTGIQFLSCGVGPAAKEIWPVSGLLTIFVCAIIVRQCLRVFLDQPAQRIRAAGFFLFFTGIIVLAAAIGFGRAYIGPIAGFETRYITLVSPLLMLLFFQCEVHGTPALKRHVPRTLFVLMGLLLVINTQKGISYTTNLWKNLAIFEQDMRDGISPEAMGLRYYDQWGPGMREIFNTRLAWLQQARLGPYRRPTPKFGEGVRLQGIGRQEPGSQNIEPLRLAAGNSFAQCFSVKEDGLLRRIDLRIDIGDATRPIKRLNWSLFKIAPDGRENLVAADYLDPNRAYCNYYISIPLGNVAVRKAQQFAFVLSVPADAPREASLEIPMYQEEKGACPPFSPFSFSGSMKGFLYLGPSDRSSSVVARGAEEDGMK